MHFYDQFPYFGKWFLLWAFFEALWGWDKGTSFLQWRLLVVCFWEPEKEVFSLVLRWGEERRRGRKFFIFSLMMTLLFFVGLLKGKSLIYVGSHLLWFHFKDINLEKREIIPIWSDIWTVLLWLQLIYIEILTDISFGMFSFFASVINWSQRHNCKRAIWYDESLIKHKTTSCIS